MSSNAHFRAFVLSSVFSMTLSFSALSVGEQDFKNARLEKEWEEAGEVVRKKITDSPDLDVGLQAARKIEALTRDEAHETTHTFLRQILEIENAHANGNPEQQDSQTLFSFGAQIEKIFTLHQMSSALLQKFNDKSRTLTQEEQAKIVSTAGWLNDSFPGFHEARQVMARTFFLRRVGFNSHHKETAFKATWEALVNVKKLDLILKTLMNLGEDPEIRRIYDITEGTHPVDIALTRKKLNNLPSYLLEGFPEFQVPESITFTLLQLHALKDIYYSPFLILWSGDNQKILNAKKTFTLSQIQALRDLGMEIEADDALREVFALQGRQSYLNEINARVLGRLYEFADKT